MLLATKVVHCKKSPYDIYIGRPSKWGNPFKLIKNASDVERKKVLDKYRIYLYNQIADQKLDPVELYGKILGCFCIPKDCHGNILAQIAEERFNHGNDNTT